MRRCRKMISLIMLMVMLVSLLPSGAMAAEAPTGATNEVAAVEEPQNDTDVAENTDITDGETDKSEEVPADTSVSDVNENEPTEGDVIDVVPADETTAETTEEDPTEGVTAEDAGLGNTSTEIAAEEEPADGKTAEDAGLGKTSTETAAVVEPTEQTVEKEEKAAGGDIVDYVGKDKLTVKLYKEKYNDAGDLISSVEVGKNSENEYDVNPSDNPFKLLFRFENVTFAPGTYTHQLPSKIKYEMDPNQTPEIKFGDDTIATFSVTEGGLLTVVFNENANNHQNETISIGFNVNFGGENHSLVTIDDVPIRIDYKRVGEPKIEKKTTGRSGTTLKWSIDVTCDEEANAVGLTVMDRVGNSHNHKFNIEQTFTVIAKDANGNKKAQWTIGGKNPGSNFIWVKNEDGNYYGWNYTIPEKAPSDATEGAGVQFGLGWDFSITSVQTTATITPEDAGRSVRYYNYAYLYDKNTKIGDNSTSRLWSIGGASIRKAGKYVSKDGSTGTKDYMEWTVTVSDIKPDEWEPEDWLVIGDYLRGSQYKGNSTTETTSFAIGKEIVPEWENLRIDITLADGKKEENVPIYKWDEGAGAGAGGASASGYWFRYKDVKHKDTSSYYGSPYGWLYLYNVNSEGSSVSNVSKIVVTYRQKVTTELLELLDTKDALNIYNTGCWAKNNYIVDSYIARLPYEDSGKKIESIATKDNKYQVTFAIDYTPSDADISKYESIIITDEMSDTMSMIRESLSVTATGVDGYVHDVKYNDKDFYDNHKLHLQIYDPDLYTYHITYKCTVSNDPNDANASGDIDYWNKFQADVDGEIVATDETGATLSNYDGEAHRYTIRVNKVDEKGAALKGAVIEIFTGDDALFKAMTTGEDGIAEFSTNVKEDIVFKQNSPYYIQETKAPQGYQKDGKKYWFVISEKGFDGYQEDSYWENYFGDKNYTIIKPTSSGSSGSTSATAEFEIVNKLENTEIPVEKVWNDNKTQHDSVTVELYAGGEKPVKTMVLNEENSFKGKFTGLSKTDASGKTIVYTVKEVTVAGYKSVVTGSAAEGFKITNTYDATGKTTLNGSKTIENREFKEGDKWTFEVSAVTKGAPMPAKTTVEINPTSGKSADFTFGDISFKLADMGGAKEKTFEYEIKESGTVAGVTNDSVTHSVSIKVTDDGKGKLNAVKTYTDGDKTNNEKAEFVNTYGADGTYQLKGVKTLTGRAFAEGDKWTFTVTAEKGTPMPAKTEVVIEPTSGTSAAIDFGTIKYSLANAGKTYTYTVTETGTISGVTNDPKNVKTVKVKVEDNGQGKLTATPTEDSQKVEYKNIYNATGKTTLNGSKTIENREFKEGDTWTFKVTAVTEGAPMPKDTEVTINPTSGNSADFTFGEISFKLADMAGAKEKTFEYKIEESGTIKGVSNDGGSHTVSVKVTDDGKGHLEAVNTYTDGEIKNNEKSKFVNVYSAKGEYTLTGTKTIAGRNFQEGDKWTFTVTAEEGTPMPEKTEVVIEPTSGTTADIDFGTIKYSLANAGKTYTYTVTETGTIAGVTNDTANVKTVKIKVEDDGEGGLTATATEDSDAVAFTNTYNATGSIELPGKKVLENRSFREGDKWTFTIEAKDGAPLPAETAVEVTPEAGETEEEFSIGTISYVLSDLGGNDTRTFEYTITESGTVSGVVNDIKNTRTVKVEVTDKKDGNLEAVLTEDSEEVTFTNTHISFSKQDVDGKEIKDATIQILDENSSVIDQWVSEEDKSHEVTGLEAGKTYTMHEVSAPDGFTVTTDIVFMVDEDHKVKVIDQTTDGETEIKDGKVIMTDKKTKVTFSKQDVDGTEIGGAEIQILDEEGKPVDSWTSVEGESHELEGLVTGKKYTMHEVNAPDGFTVTTDIVFTIDTDGTVKVIDQTTDGETIVEDGKVIMTDKKTKVTFSKQDVGGIEIGGAEIQILDEEGKVVDEWTSVEGESHELEGLVTGKKYTMHEVNAPETFVVATDITFTIDTDGTVKVIDQSTNGDTIVEDGKVIMTDEKSKVTVSKVDTGTGKELPGAKIQIIDKDGKVVEEWTSTTEPHVIEGLLTNEKYILREKVAPLGYTLTSDTTFTIDEYGKVTSSGTINKEGMLVIEDTMTEVDILKVDSKTGKGLKGAKLQVLDDNGTVCEEWTSTKDAHKINGLYTGVKYTLHEVEAPKGYDKAKDITFTIDTAGKVSSDALENGVVVMKDTPTPSKSKNKTGDEANGALWALLLMMAGGALGGTVWFKRKKRA